MWSYWICDTRTGMKQLRVEPATAPFSRMLNEAGKGSAGFVLTDDSPMRDKALSTPWARTLVHCWDDVPKFAGMIEKRKYGRDDRTLSLSTVDARAFLGARYPFGVSSYWANEPAHIPGRLVWSGLSLRAIAARTIWEGLQGPYDTYGLPFVLPFGDEVGTAGLTVENYSFQTVADILADLQERDGGPDSDFEPRWSTTGTLEWYFRAGSTAAPDLVGDVFEFNMSAEQPRLTGLSFTEDGAKQVTGMFSIGAGSEVDMRVGGWGVAGAATIPARDGTQSLKQEVSEPILASYSVAAVQRLGTPTEQWEMSCMASEEPGLANLKLGSILRLFFSDDPWITDPSVDVRLISFSGDTSDKITLDVQPWG